MPSYLTSCSAFSPITLVCQRNLSAHTRNGYRDTFRLFLSARNRRAIDQLTLDVVSPESVLTFLNHLETARSNVARTRNLRLLGITGNST